MKAKIFIGPRSGKTRVANLISEFVGKKNTAIISINKRNWKEDYFLFGSVPINTELLIVEDCPIDFDYSIFFSVLDKRPEGEIEFLIKRQAQGEYPVILSIPKLILITEKLNPNFEFLDASFTEHFDIIEFPLNKHCKNQ